MLRLLFSGVVKDTFTVRLNKLTKVGKFSFLILSEYINVEPHDLNIYFPLSLNNEYIKKMQLGNAPQNVARINLQTKGSLRIKKCHKKGKKSTIFLTPPPTLGSDVTLNLAGVFVIV